MKRRALVVANWKMNGQKAGVKALTQALCGKLVSGPSKEVVICPPFVFLAQLQEALVGSTLGLGAQNLFSEDKGAYTGEVAAPMLREFGCDFVIVGHSERRTLFGETDAFVAAKFAAALHHGLIPILCVGESAAEQEARATVAVVTRQLEAVIEQTGPRAFLRAVVAYEPVWAIGTGMAATPESAQAVHKAIRDLIATRDPEAAGKVRILYGGSVNVANAKQFFAQPDVDGALVGGASLVAEEFIAICASLD
jgi:triosephosphate isomerase